MEKIIFTQEGEAPVGFYVLEQTRIAGMDYLLVSDTEEGDGNALILKDLSKEEEKEGVYGIVSEEEELTAVAKVFESLLDGIEFVEE